MTIPKAVMVLSGKGGVGKTLVSVNLALALKNAGKKVGLLDADFSASNSGYFLPLEGRIDAIQDTFTPIQYDGLQVFSIPLVIGEKSVSMGGDQYGQLLADAVDATLWDVEYLIVDCPAGFGDTLTTAAKVLADSLLGSVIVVQPAHELDAKRALRLHKELEMPVLGLIENMSYFKAGAVTYKIFGESVVDNLGKEFEVPVFGKIPLTMDIRNNVAEKKPLLEGEYAEPINNAVEAIQKAKPTKPGFLAKIVQRLKQNVDRFIVNLAIELNQEINIPDVQQRFGYPGGTIIRLNIMDDAMNSIISQADWIVNDGKLTVAEGNYNIDAQIDITVNAIKWTILQNRSMSNGQPYNFADALRLGHMKIYAPKSMVRGIYFMQHVFTELRQNQNAMSKIGPILKLM